MKVKNLFTIGYGNDPPETFTQRLENDEIQDVYDVRRPSSRSWNRAYYAGRKRYDYCVGQPPKNIGELIFGGTRYCSYWPLWFDDNKLHFGKPKDMSLEQYRVLIRDRAHQIVLENLASFIDGNRLDACLLCAEKSHIGCHRTIVAEELLLKLNKICDPDMEWQIRHI